MFSGSRACLFILLYITGFQGFAQVVTNVTHYSTVEGLSDNRITDIIKDKDGFMWFASWAGITRFDGYNFLTFKSYPGDRSVLRSNRIDELSEDPGGRYLWLRAYDRHVYRFDKTTQQFIALSDLVQQKSLAKVAITKIVLVRDHEVWLISEDRGLILIKNPETERPSYVIFSNSAAASYRLPSNSIRYIHADKRGNVWVQTGAGMAIVQSVKSGEYRAIVPSWGVASQFKMNAEAKGSLWLIRHDGALLLVGADLNHARVYKIQGLKPNRMLASRKTGILYCTTNKGELYSISSRGSADLLVKLKEPSPLYYIYEDSFGTLWIESERFGVIRYEPSLRSTQYLFPTKNYSFIPNGRNINIFEDRNSVTWTVLKGQLYFFDRANQRMQPIAERLENYRENSSINIMRTFYDPTGVLWVGNGFDGINKVVFQEHDFKQTLLVPGSKNRVDNEVRGLLVDRRNRVWAGTKAGNLYVTQDGKRIPILLKGNLINDAGIYTLIEDKRGNIWFGTKANGLVKASPADATGKIYTVSQYVPGRDKQGSISGNSIYCLFEDSKGRIWAGSYGDGLILVEEKEGKLHFKTVYNSFKNYPKEGYEKIRHIGQDAKGRIWVGTTNGLLIFNPDSGAPEDYQFRRYKKEPGNIQSLGGNDIQFIFRDSRNNMWVLTTTGGLNLAVGSESLESLSFLNYSVKDGLPSDFLLACLEDREANLWIATQNGLAKFSISSRKFQNFNYDDGLPESSFSEISCAKMRDGQLIFGTSNGYLSFDPQKIEVEKIKAALAFTNVQVNSEDVHPGPDSPLKFSINNTRELRLNHDQNIISIDFAVLDFHSINKQNYWYRLVGFDNVWRSAGGQRRATYTKLPPGEYQFEVKALNDELYEDVPAKSLKIVVLPPLWRTWWAYLIYTILVAVAVFIIRRVAITLLKLRQGIEVERRLADLKLNFFTQISHELRTPLTLIINPSEEVLEHEKLSTKGRDYVSVVVRNAHRMLRLVNQVLDLRKVQSGKSTLKFSDVEIRSFVGGILEYFKETIAHKSLQIEIICPFKQLLVSIDEEKIEIVLFNLIANAIKFSPDGNVITVSIGSDEQLKQLTIAVTDKGPGVHANELQDIFKLYYEGKHEGGNHVKGTGIGLALARELVELHKGRIFAEHNSPTGLKVIVELPLVNRGGSVPAVADEYSDEQEPDVLEPQNLIGQDEPQDLRADLPLVLIVEDNDDLRRFLVSKFSGHYRVETAANGKEGESKARELVPDLILSDVMMPEMDGIQLLDKLKTEPSTSHIPVILLTAKSSVESQVQGLSYGADYYITKPFRMALLQAAVKNIMARRKGIFAAIQNKEEKDSIENAPEVAITEYDRAFLEKILKVVESRLNDVQFNIDDVAESMDMSRSTFYRKFKSLTNTTPVEFVREIRLKKAKELFDAGEDNISTAAYAVGFNNPKYFAYCFRSQYQQSPSEYVKEVKGQRKKNLQKS